MPEKYVQDILDKYNVENFDNIRLDLFLSKLFPGNAGFKYCIRLFKASAEIKEALLEQMKNE